MGHRPDSCPVTLPYQAHRLVLWLQRRVPSGKPKTRCPYPHFFIFTAFGSCSFSCSFFSSHAPTSHPLFLLIWLFPTSSLIPPPHCLATTATAPFTLSSSCIIIFAPPYDSSFSPLLIVLTGMPAAYHVLIHQYVLEPKLKPCLIQSRKGNTF